MMLICLGGGEWSVDENADYVGQGEGIWSGFHRAHPAFIGVLLCLCTIGFPAAGMHMRMGTGGDTVILLNPPLISMALYPSLFLFL